MPEKPSSISSRHITWEQLQARIREGIPFVHRIPAPNPTVPALEIRMSELGQELALWLPCTGSGKAVLSPLAEIDIDVIQTTTGQMIEIRTRSESLYQEIYNFFVSVIDKVQLNGVDPFVALSETIEGWRELLKARVILSEEAQLGLRGELNLLRRLISVIGDNALMAWTGPQRQPHDFRFGEIEIEVKVTRGSKHRHIINGLAQLEASPSHRLYVYSLCLAPAGAEAGTTLSDDIGSTREMLQPIAQDRFRRILKDHFGYRQEHSFYYQQPMQLANKPLLIVVDAGCPRLTSELIGSVPHRERIDDVQYRANFEGLGFQDGSVEFQAVFDQHLNLGQRLPAQL
jgi:Putative  PD-(D/E)XK family member, (DUF4420)